MGVVLSKGFVLLLRLALYHLTADDEVPEEIELHFRRALEGEGENVGRAVHVAVVEVELMALRLVDDADGYLSVVPEVLYRGLSPFPKIGLGRESLGALGCDLKIKRQVQSVSLPVSAEKGPGTCTAAAPAAAFAAAAFSAASCSCFLS